MKCRYSVTFEFSSRRPLTHRSTLEAGSPGTIARRALMEAKKELKPINWSSLVVFLERLDEKDEKDEKEEVVEEGEENEEV